MTLKSIWLFIVMLSLLLIVVALGTAVMNVQIADLFTSASEQNLACYACHASW